MTDEHPHPAGALIVAESLRKSYPAGSSTVEILHDVSLTVSEGEVCAIMGPSGSGKSTLMYCLAGLEQPTSGDVALLGESLARRSRRQLAELRRRELGFVFQSYNLMPTLSVSENVALPFRLRGERVDRARIEEALAAVGLAGRGASSPSSMSGGEQQRVAIARVLAQRPQIVFADEPTGALDSRSGRVVLSELRRIGGRRGSACSSSRTIRRSRHRATASCSCATDGSSTSSPARPPSRWRRSSPLLEERIGRRRRGGGLMRALVVAELRSAWTSWLAVLVAFVATSFSIVLAMLAIDSLARHRSRPARCPRGGAGAADRAAGTSRSRSSARSP